MRNAIRRPVTPFLLSTCAGLLALQPGPLVAQASGGETWHFRVEAQADLWYHGLAVIGFRGFGPLPLYDPGHPQRAADHKTGNGIPPTRLDRERGRLLAAFEADSLFEILHFVPVYFAGGTPRALIHITRTASQGRRANTEAYDGRGGRLVAQALGAVSSTPEQRRVLGDFADALEQELTAGLPPYPRPADDIATAAQEWWLDNITPHVKPFLEEAGFSGGVVLIPQALGPEGRIFRGAPDVIEDNVIAVGVTDVSRPEGVSFSLLREICYPIVTALVRELGVGGRDRQSAERTSSRAAVRCGAAVVDRFVSTHSDAYRSHWVRAAGNASRTPSDVFESTFPVPETLRSAIARRVGG